MSVDPHDAAACCAAFYEQDWVRALLGDAFHPGGEALSRRLLEDLELATGDRVLDLACGTGTTALLAHDLYDVRVTGLDASTSNLDRARVRARSRPVTFVGGYAHALPFDDDAFDAVLCECAVSTFADKPAVAREVRRVLAPGGRLGITDMAVYDALPEDLAAFGQGWACVDDALTLEGYRALFASAGLAVLRVEDESAALHDMVLQLKKRLLVAGLGQAQGIEQGMGIDLPTLRGMLDRAKTLVNDGTVRYGRLGFREGAARSTVASARRSTACDPSTGCC